MKQVLTYISPDKKFNEEHEKLAKIQIDNSLSLGWKPEDTLIVTNFPYEYKGVKAIQAPDECFCPFTFPPTKIYTICWMFEQGLIGDDLYWYHDFDCYQLNPISDPLDGKDFGITNYGRMPRLCSASIFFKKEAADIFSKLKKKVDADRTNEEVGLMRLLTDEEINKRVKRLNITYAFHKFNLPSCWKIADHPIRAAHFHATPDKFDFYIKGNNKLGIPLLPERLINIFKNYYG